MASNPQRLGTGDNPEREIKILVGRHEAASLLSVSCRTIDNLVRAKQLRPRRIGARVLFLRSDLESFARRAS
jgi:excisionase family DNA binding protein